MQHGFNVIFNKYVSNVYAPHYYLPAYNQAGLRAAGNEKKSYDCRYKRSACKCKEIKNLCLLNQDN